MAVYRGVIGNVCFILQSLLAYVDILSSTLKVNIGCVCKNIVRSLFTLEAFSKLVVV